MKLRLFAIAAMLVSGVAGAAEKVEPPQLSPPDAWEKRDTGTIRLMNKIDSTVQAITLRVGETKQVETLSIELRGCFVRPADLPQDATARLTITDSRPGAPGFSGWILMNEPAINMLEHPVYDVQLAGCA